MYRGAFVVALRILNWILCMMNILDWDLCMMQN